MDHFGIIWYAEKTEPVKFSFLEEIMEEIYKEKIKKVTDTQLKINKKVWDKTISESLDNVKQSIFGFSKLHTKDSDFIRGQLASWIANSLSINYRELVTHTFNSVYERWKNNNAPKKIKLYDVHFVSQW